MTLMTNFNLLCSPVLCPLLIPPPAQSDLAEWLGTIGLLQYHKKLTDSGYDSMGIVQDLTWEDLQEIGIVKLGEFQPDDPQEDWDLHCYLFAYLLLQVGVAG